MLEVVNNFAGSLDLELVHNIVANLLKNQNYALRRRVAILGTS